MIHTGRPVAFRLAAPAYAAAACGWVPATVALAASADEVARGAVSAAGAVLAAHLVGLVLFALAVETLAAGALAGSEAAARAGAWALAAAAVLTAAGTGETLRRVLALRPSRHGAAAGAGAATQPRR